MTALLLGAPAPAVAAIPDLRDRPLSAFQNDDVLLLNSVPASDYTDNIADDAGDAFFFTPGVWVNRLDIQEPRITIRGFGMATRQERYGATLLRDGTPLTDVHGENNVFEIDLLSMDRVEILRPGSTHLSYGVGSLGGGVNFNSTSGRGGPFTRARADLGVSIQGAPNGRLHAGKGGASGDFDYFISGTAGYDAGFRNQNALADGRAYLNIGYAPLERFQTRFFGEIAYADAENAGGLDLVAGENDPAQAALPIIFGPLFPGGPIITLADGAVDDDFSRQIGSARIANETRGQLLAHDLILVTHYARRNVVSPQIDYIGVIDEDGGEWGARLTALRDGTLAGMEASYAVGASYTSGARDADRFENLNGERDRQTLDSRQKSAVLNTFVETALRPVKRLLLEAGARLSIVDRELTVAGGGTQERRYAGASARFAASYQLTDNVSVYASAARAWEAPSMDALTSEDPGSFAGLDEQDATIFEAGLRGSLNERFTWDLAVYTADAEDEVLSADDPESGGLGDTIVNVDATTHRGVELGASLLAIAPGGAFGEGSVILRGAYAYNDYHFDDADPFGIPDGNRIAGVPTHVFRGEIRYDQGERWYLGANIDVGAGDYFVDHANDVAAPSYAVIGVTAGYRLNERVMLMASGDNLTNQRYAGGLTTVEALTTANTRLYSPAEGAVVYGGLTIDF